MWKAIYDWWSCITQHQDHWEEWDVCYAWGITCRKCGRQVDYVSRLQL